MCHACVCTGSFVLECHALYLQHFLFIEEKAAKDVEPFRNGSVHEFYRLKALITLEHGIDYFSGGKKKILTSKTSKVRVTGWVLKTLIVC